jgi:hypothetical protein
MNSIIRSLRLCWPITADNRGYVINLLRQAGITPEDPRLLHATKFAQLWATVQAGRLLGEDITAWEQALEAETARLTEVQERHDQRTSELEAYIAALKDKIAENEAAIVRLNQK